jgi:hypothetical protein
MFVPRRERFRAATGPDGPGEGRFEFFEDAAGKAAQAVIKKL